MNFPSFFNPDFITALIIWGCSLLLGILLDQFILKRLRNFAIKAESPWRGELFNGFIGKATYIFFFIGLYGAILYAPIPEKIQRYGSLGSFIIIIMFATVALSTIAANILLNKDEEINTGYKSYTIVINLVRVLFFAFGLLIILRTIGISITPMLTALGVASLAVALALQDTLGNLFAGINMIAGKRIRPGDYVKLENGQEGMIEDISWRSTLIRQLNNNRIVVPNQKIGSAILLNYSLEETYLQINIPVGIAYTSDLEHVERVTIEEAKKVQKEVSGDIESFVPVVRYTSFGDSSINFIVIVRASHFIVQGLLIDKVIRALHKRYQSEKIEIPYPMQNVVMRKDLE